MPYCPQIFCTADLLLLVLLNATNPISSTRLVGLEATGQNRYGSLVPKTPKFVLGATIQHVWGFSWRIRDKMQVAQSNRGIGTKLKMLAVEIQLVNLCNVITQLDT